MHFTWVPPHYLVVTIALYLSTVRLKVLLYDCSQAEVLVKKELISPNPSVFKTFFSDPFFCILYGRAKMLLVDIRAVI